MGAAAKKTERTMTAHFVIDGPWLCDLARTLWADEGKPEKAINLLRTAFPPMEQTDILAVLTGFKKLIGDSDQGITLVPDTATKSKHGNLLDAASVIAKFRQELDEESNTAADLQQMLAGDVVFMGSPRGAVSVPRRRTVAGLNGRRGLKDGVDLDKIPHHEWPDFGKRGPGEPPLFPTDTEARLRAWEDRLLRSPSPPAVAVVEDLREQRKRERSEKPVDPPPRKPQPPDPHDTIDADCGWLSPEGKFYPCEYGGHVGLAYELTGLLGDVRGEGERSLEKLNWIKVQNGEFRRDDYEKPPTQRQRDVIFDWAQTKGVKMPWLCREDLETEEAWDDALDEMGGGRRPEP